MSAKFKRGMVIFRRWDSQDGLNEIAKRFSSIDELLGLCLQTESDLLVERVVLDGTDQEGSPRTVTLTFQSVTIQDGEHGE
jgi:hypothetical protein